MTTQVYVVNVIIDVEVLGTVPVRAVSQQAARRLLHDSIGADQEKHPSKQELQERLNEHFSFDDMNIPGSFHDIEVAYDQDHCEVTPADLAEAFNDGRLEFEGTPFITQASFRQKMSEAGKNVDSVQADEADD